MDGISESECSLNSNHNNSSCNRSYESTEEDVDSITEENDYSDKISDIEHKNINDGSK